MSALLGVILSATLTSAQEAGALPRWLGDQAPKSFDDAVARLEARFRRAGAEEVVIQAIPESDASIAERVDRQTRGRLARLGVPNRMLEELVNSRRDLEGANGSNVIVQLPGRGFRQLVVAAPLGTPDHRQGLGDSWSACALLPHLYRQWAEKPLEHSVTFVAFGAEAYGHRGVDAYLASLGDLVEDIDAVVFVQGLGHSLPHAWEGGSARSLLIAGTAVSERTDIPLEIREFVDHGSNAGPTAAFRTKGVPGLFLDGLDFENVRLRSPKDGVESIDPELLERTARFVQEMVIELDQFQLRLDFAGVLESYDLERDTALTRIQAVRYRLLAARGPKPAEAKTDPKAAGEPDPDESESPSRERFP